MFDYAKGDDSITFAAEEEDARFDAEADLSTDSLPKAAAILSHAFRFRYPLDCGGNAQHLRFIGATISPADSQQNRVADHTTINSGKIRP